MLLQESLAILNRALQKLTVFRFMNCIIYPTYAFESDDFPRYVSPGYVKNAYSYWSN